MLLRIVVNYKTLESYKKWMNLKLEVKLKKLLKICPQLRLRNYLLKMKKPQVTTMKIMFFYETMVVVQVQVGKFGV
jgi:hypothetical protein